MLAYITPLGVVLVVVVADRAMQWIPARSLRYGLVAAWFASLVVLSPIPTSQGYGVTPTRLSSIALFMAPKSIDYQTFQGFFTTSGFPPGPLYDIFLPKVLTPDGHEVGPNAIIPLYQRLHQRQAGAQSLTTHPVHRRCPLARHLRDAHAHLYRALPGQDSAGATNQLQRVLHGLRPERCWKDASDSLLS